MNNTSFVFLLFENQLQPPTPTFEPIHCIKKKKATGTFTH